MRPSVFAIAVTIPVFGAGPALAEEWMTSSDPLSRETFQIICTQGNPPDWMVIRWEGGGSRQFKLTIKHRRFGESELVSDHFNKGERWMDVVSIDDSRVRLYFGHLDVGVPIALISRDRSPLTVVYLDSIELKNPGVMSPPGNHMTTDVVVQLAHGDGSFEFSGCSLTGSAIPKDSSQFTYKNILGESRAP